MHGGRGPVSCHRPDGPGHNEPWHNEPGQDEPWQDAEQRLLVITDHRRNGRDALAIGFAEATVVAPASEPDELLLPSDGDDARFDTLVIDRSSFSLRWLHAITARALPILRPHGWVLIRLGLASSARLPDIDPPPLHHLRWHGLTVLNGQPCAVLRTGGDAAGPGCADRSAAGLTGAMLTAADGVLRLAAGAPAGPSSDISGFPLADVLSRRLTEQRRSEHALLAHLDVLATALRQEQQRNRRWRLVRTALRRWAAGRSLLRLLRHGAQLAQRIPRSLRAQGTQQAPTTRQTRQSTRQGT